LKEEEVKETILNSVGTRLLAYVEQGTKVIVAGCADQMVKETLEVKITAGKLGFRFKPKGIGSWAFEDGTLWIETGTGAFGAPVDVNRVSTKSLQAVM